MLLRQARCRQQARRSGGHQAAALSTVRNRANTATAQNNNHLRGALQKAASDKAAVTDDCSAVERLGMKIRLVAGDERNLKVTTPLDLKIAELLLEEGQ